MSRLAPQPPTAIGEFDIISALSPTTFRAMAPGGAAVILKQIPDDCLVDGRLHPEVHARLARVRELAHAGIANLRSVERGNGKVYGVWDDVPGEPIDVYAQSRADTPVARRRLVRELVTAVDTLNHLGVVHGALQANNILVDAGGSLRITHVSPYLHEDFATDRQAVAALLQTIARSTNPPDELLLAAASDATQSLRPIVGRLTSTAAASDSVDHTGAAVRANAWLAAAIVAMVGLTLAIIIYLAVR